MCVYTKGKNPLIYAYVYIYIYTYNIQIQISVCTALSSSKSNPNPRVRNMFPMYRLSHLVGICLYGFGGVHYQGKDYTCIDVFVRSFKYITYTYSSMYICLLPGKDPEYI